VTCQWRLPSLPPSGNPEDTTDFVHFATSFAGVLAVAGFNYKIVSKETQYMVSRLFCRR
jgi:hypothetical protein